MDRTERSDPIVEFGEGRLRIFWLRARQSLRLEGDVDHTTLPVLADALASATRDGGALYVDLGGVGFVDVGGLRALVAAASRLQGGRGLTLLSAPPYVRRLLVLTGWDHAPGLRPHGAVRARRGEGPQAAASAGPAAEAPPVRLSLSPAGGHLRGRGRGESAEAVLAGSEASHGVTSAGSA
ncbi:STAS domain-containing protein [Sphaerisporangium sp. NPDC049002]|uniref:STAS domain-containing protein n=1 Tax=unclassified Sphaerisporangium TaxID=2630420 RepID=UPI0033FF8223